MFHGFWYGDLLPPYAWYCLRSFVDRGEPFRLYAYKKLDAPRGVLIKDAAEVLPESSIFYYKNPDGSRRSVAGFANLFRYILLERRGGWWVDTDVLRLDAPLPRDELYLGEEDDSRINNAIIRAPAGHPLLVEAVKRAAAAGTDLFWGQTGPRLITALVDEMGLRGATQGFRVAYPTNQPEYAMAVEARFRTDMERLTKRAPFLHLWHESFRMTNDPRLDKPEPGSFLAERYARIDAAWRAAGLPRRVLTRLARRAQELRERTSSRASMSARNS